MIRKIVLTIVIFIISIVSCLASPKISTHVNAKKIGLNDILSVTYSATEIGAIVDQEIPRYKDFIQVGISQSSNSNGEYSITVHLQPTKTGTFTIPGITIYTKDGKSVNSGSIQVQVVKGKVGANSGSNNSLPSPSSRSVDIFQQMDDQLTLMDLYSQLEIVKNYLEKSDLSKFDREKLKRYKAQLQSAIKDIEEHYATNPKEETDVIYPDQNLKSSFFVKAIPSKRKAYVGEPIIVTYKIFSITSFSNGQIQKLPVLNDFVSKDFKIETNPKAKRDTYNGKSYMSIDVKKCIVYPSRKGSLVIDPLEISAFTDRFGRVNVSSDPEIIEVVDLPNVDQHPDYTGGMGRFAISSAVDKVDISTDDIATLTFTVGGEGNLDILNAPITTGLNPNIFLGIPQVNVFTDSVDILKGKKTFSYNFSVDQPGQYEIPSIPFTYFDTDKNQFVTLKTDPIKISVRQGELKPTERGKDHQQQDHILAIKSGSLPAITDGKLWPTSIAYISTLILALVGIPMWIRRRNVVEKLKTKIPESVNKVAFGRLRNARALMGSGNDMQFYEEVSKSIWLYLSDKLGISLSSLNKQQLYQKLKEHNVNDEMIAQTEQIITECEISLYAGYNSGQQKDKILQNATALITAYENTLKS